MVAKKSTAPTQKKTSRTEQAKAAVKATLKTTIDNLLPDPDQESGSEAETYSSVDSQLVYDTPIDFNLAIKQPTSGSALDFSRLPLNLTVSLPDFEPLMNISDLSKPASFEAAGYGRVTNNQREQDKVQYGEHKNYIDNISDGLDVLLSTVNAAIKAAKVGQGQVRYATARESINTELNTLGIQQSKTRQGSLKLDAELQKETNLNSTNEVNTSILNTQVADLRLTLQEQQHKYLARQQTLYALIGAEAPSA